MDNIVMIKEYINFEYLTFKIKIVSGPFSGESMFCIALTVLESSISQMEAMYESLSGSYTLYDYDSDDYINIEMDKYGRVIVRGQVGGSDNDQYLKYLINTDQTELKKMIDTFKSFCN